MDKVSFSRTFFAGGAWLFCISFGTRMKPEQIPLLNMWQENVTLWVVKHCHWMLNSERWTPINIRIMTTLSQTLTIFVQTLSHNIRLKPRTNQIWIVKMLKVKERQSNQPIIGMQKREEWTVNIVCKHNAWIYYNAHNYAWIHSNFVAFNPIRCQIKNQYHNVFFFDIHKVCIVHCAQHTKPRKYKNFVISVQMIL